MSTEYDKLIDEINGMRKRIEELESILKHRQQHTHSTGACFDDSLAVAHDVLESGRTDLDEYATARLNKLVQILRVGRTGPFAYPIDPPAGRRPKGGKF